MLRALALRLYVRAGHVVGELCSVIELPLVNVYKISDFSVLTKVNVDFLLDAKRDLVYKMIEPCLGVLSEGDADIGLASVTAHTIHHYDVDSNLSAPPMVPGTSIKK